MKKFLLGLLIVILLAGCGFGAYSYYNQNKEIKALKNEIKDLKVDLDKKAKAEKLSDEVAARMDDMGSITNFLKTYYVMIKDEEKILANENNRLLFVNAELMRLNKTKDSSDFDGGAVQNSPYVSFETYLEEYNNIFGDNYSIERDYNKFFKDSIKGVVLNNCSSYNAQGQYVCWNGSVLGSEISLETVDKEYKNGIYTITGNYKAIEPGKEPIKGTLEVKYKVENDKESLLSLVLTENN